MDRQHPPAAARTDKVANRIDHLTEVDFARTSTPPGLGHQRRDPLPFLVRQIRRVTLRLLRDLGHPATALLRPHQQLESFHRCVGNPFHRFSKRPLRRASSPAVQEGPAVNTDPYLWVGPSTGRWGDPANWQDQSTNASGVPNGHNPVQFGVDTPSQAILANDTVTGYGRSVSLALYGNLTLAGTFTTGALNLKLFIELNSPYSTSVSLTVNGGGLKASSAHAAGDLTVKDGAAVSVARAYEIASGRPFGNGPDYQFDGIAVDGDGSRVTIGGLLSTDDASYIFVANGGYLEARRMTLDNT
jgi:hypothetical protein